MKRSGGYRRSYRTLAVCALLVIAAAVGAGVSNATRHTTIPEAATHASNASFTSGNGTPSTGITGPIWKTLERPLHIPRTNPGSLCKRTPGHLTLFGKAHPNALDHPVVVLGHGPVFPNLLMPVAPPAKDGVATYVDEQVKDGLHLHKTLWAISPAYDGPVLLRGRQVDGKGRLFFVIVGAGKPKTELRIPAIPLKSRHGLPWAFVASLTGIPGPGCYGFQIDGRHFSDVVIFRAQENLP